MSKHVIVDLAFEGMNEGARCHMANKLYKEGYAPIKMQSYCDELEAKLAEVQREFDIVDSACDYWKDMAQEFLEKEPTSNCCGADMPDWPDSDFCPKCKEHSLPYNGE